MFLALIGQREKQELSPVYVLGFDWSEREKQELSPVYVLGFDWSERETGVIPSLRSWL